MRIQGLLHKLSFSLRTLPQRRELDREPDAEMRAVFTCTGLAWEGQLPIGVFAIRLAFQSGAFARGVRL